MSPLIFSVLPAFRHATGLLVLSFLGAISAWSQPFSADITVAADGSGDFTSLQAAIDAVPNNSAEETLIFVKSGLYSSEKLIVPANKTNVVLIGESRDQTVIRYHLHNCATGGFNTLCPAEDAMHWTGELLQTAATLTVIGDGFRAENLTIENTAGPTGQAQAVTVRADKVIFRNCNLTGYQDTLYFWSNAKRSYFENCLIVGRTDYIYGSGTVYFQDCEIRSWGGGWITAPSTAQDQPHGFVFHSCDLTYALNSPRAGDDGATVALGRPWHNYPKVAWLYCDMTAMIDPLGWPTIWNMAYAPTSPDLHLYEYMNTGEGADMSNRADWVGIRALADDEAADYTIPAVLNGSDGWDPTATAPVVTIYEWTGDAATNAWLEADNWDPVGIPDTSEAAYITGQVTAEANGGYFAADLNLAAEATLNVTADSEVHYLAAGLATLLGQGEVSLAGSIRTKDSLLVAADETFTLTADLVGVHHIEKGGEGDLVLSGNNAGFRGWWLVSEGGLTAATASSLGEARGVAASAGATLTVRVSEAFFIETSLSLVTGSQLVLDADITLSEFYIDGVLQDVGEYSAATHPDLINGTATLLVGRPNEFTFIGGADGNWDVPEHFQPALLPEEGEAVFTEIEMETTSWEFPADITVSGGGRIRLRGVHGATGTITLRAGTSIGYATSGTGFTLDAPLFIEGDILLRMNSAAVPSHDMNLPGPISGNARVTASNHRANTANTGTVVLGGDNSGFSGVWDLTLPCENPNSVAVIQGISAHAFGGGTIEVADKNVLALAHTHCVGDSLLVTLLEEGRIRLDVPVEVNYAEINGAVLLDGTYDAIADPGIFTGEGVLIVGTGTASGEVAPDSVVYFAEGRLFVRGDQSEVTVYNLSGQPVIQQSREKEVSLRTHPAGVYLIRYWVDGRRGVLKVVR